MTNRIWILGAADPEMMATETLLRSCGETLMYASPTHGVRCHAGNAYSHETQVHTGMLVREVAQDGDFRVYTVECATPIVDAVTCDVTHIDHHRPGDPGFGAPPEEFFRASSLGQVISELARLGALPESWTRWRTPVKGLSSKRAGEIVHLDSWRSPCPGHSVFLGRQSATIEWAESADGMRAAGSLRTGADQLVYARIPDDLGLVAAADHCLGHAYRGACPGVDPDALLQWRAEQRAAAQGVQPAEILRAVEFAIDDLVDRTNCCRVVVLSAEPYLAAVDVTDTLIPELPEAACRFGAAYLAAITDPGGRKKLVLGGSTTPEHVRAFLEHWAPAQGLVDCYGDPARGFAGGYCA